MSTIQANISKIQRYSINDGPGIRTTVFLKGCPLSCKWCHNPDSITAQQVLMFNSNLCTSCKQCAKVCCHNVHQFDKHIHKVYRENCIKCGSCTQVCPTQALSLSGQKMTLDEVIKVILRDSAYYIESGGGVTISGGEPLMQPEFVKALIEECHANRLHVCIDTSGYVLNNIFREIAEITDCFLYDLKLMDPDKHVKYTGVDNELILKNFKAACTMKKEIIVRQVVIPGINDDKENYKKVAAFLKECNASCLIELLPYHSYGKTKYDALGRTYELDDVIPPSSEKLNEIKNYYEANEFKVIVR